MGRPPKPYDTQSRTYRIWSGMKSRCQDPKNPKFPHYGGRGIEVCERWQAFENFLADMGECPPDHSIDRINNDGNYEPGNCRWANMRTQRLNSRQNRILIYNGVSLTVTEWAEKLGVDRNALFARLREGWTPRRAIETPFTKKPRIELTPNLETHIRALHAEGKSGRQIAAELGVGRHVVGKVLLT